MPPADLDLIELHAFAVALARSMRGADRSSVDGALVRVMPLFRLQEAPANALPEEEQSTWESAESSSLRASHYMERVLRADRRRCRRGDNAVGSVTIAIRNDGTYTATERRRASTWSYSGAVVAKGRAVTLRSSSGTWVSLTHRGDTLYGVAHDRTGYTLQVSVEKESAAPASSPSAQGRPE